MGLAVVSSWRAFEVGEKPVRGYPAEGSTSAICSTELSGRMAGRGSGCGLQPPAVAQPPVSGHLYPFVRETGAESEGPEEEGEVSELRPRGREKVRRSASRDRLDDIVLLTKDIQEGDTLNAIALQYCCSVSPRRLSLLPCPGHASVLCVQMGLVPWLLTSMWATPCSSGLKKVTKC